MNIGIGLASAAIAFAWAGSPVLAQSINPDRMDRLESTQSSSGREQAFGKDNSQPGTSGQGWSDREDWRDRHSGDDGRRSMRGEGDGRWGAMWRMHQSMISGAAHFHLRRGDAVMDIRCPENDSLQACVTAAGQLLDKIAAMRNRPAQGSSLGPATGGGSDVSQPAGNGNAAPGQPSR